MDLCGFGGVGGDTSRPLAPRDEDGVGPCASLCGTPTSEMSNARLVGPDPAPNHSDWPARAVCAPRWVCRSEGVAGALSFKCLGKRAVPGPLSLTGPSQRSGWEDHSRHLGVGGNYTAFGPRTTRASAYADGLLPPVNGGWFDKAANHASTWVCKVLGARKHGHAVGTCWVKQVNWHSTLPVVDQVTASSG